jgi:hypothetical protein
MSHSLSDDVDGDRERRPEQDHVKVAQSPLRPGRPVYYRGEDNTPPNACLKEYPDGCREFVRFDQNGKEFKVANWSRTLHRVLAT